MFFGKTVLGTPQGKERHVFWGKNKAVYTVFPRFSRCFPLSGCRTVSFLSNRRVMWRSSPILRVFSILRCGERRFSTNQGGLCGVFWRNKGGWIGVFSRFFAFSEEKCGVVKLALPAAPGCRELKRRKGKRPGAPAGRRGEKRGTNVEKCVYTSITMGKIIGFRLVFWKKNLPRSSLRAFFSSIQSSQPRSRHARRLVCAILRAASIISSDSRT